MQAEENTKIIEESVPDAQPAQEEDKKSGLRKRKPKIIKEIIEKKGKPEVINELNYELNEEVVFLSYSIRPCLISKNLLKQDLRNYRKSYSKPF
jgi:Holliday junction resolvasome RuvABC ATP-dependent DNA helicase subunit